MTKEDRKRLIWEETTSTKTNLERLDRLLIIRLKLLLLRESVRQWLGFLRLLLGQRGRWLRGPPIDLGRINWPRLGLGDLRRRVRPQ